VIEGALATAFKALAAVWRKVIANMSNLVPRIVIESHLQRTANPRTALAWLMDKSFFLSFKDHKFEGAESMASQEREATPHKVVTLLGEPHNGGEILDLLKARPPDETTIYIYRDVQLVVNDAMHYYYIPQFWITLARHNGHASWKSLDGEMVASLPAIYADRLQNYFIHIGVLVNHHPRESSQIDGHEICRRCFHHVNGAVSPAKFCETESKKSCHGVDHNMMMGDAKLYAYHVPTRYVSLW
jgi:hypothetical protein